PVGRQREPDELAGSLAVDERRPREPRGIALDYVVQLGGDTGLPDDNLALEPPAAVHPLDSSVLVAEDVQPSPTNHNVRGKGSMRHRVLRRPACVGDGQTADRFPGCRTYPPL